MGIENGVFLDAAFRDDEIIGNVFIQYPNGDHYYGGYMNGLKSGHGTFFCAIENSTYDGMHIKYY